MFLKDRLRLKLKMKTEISLCMAIMPWQSYIYTVQYSYCVIIYLTTEKSGIFSTTMKQQEQETQLTKIVRIEKDKWIEEGEEHSSDQRIIPQRMRISYRAVRRWT